MTDKRMLSLAKRWADNRVCSLSDGEAVEYHKRVLETLQNGGWISVKDRLPLPFENVMCFFPNKNFGSQIEVSYFESNSGGCADAFKYNPPTHWRPLPEPPKGE